MKNETVKIIIIIISIISMAAGVFGMIYSFPFLWSENMADLVGAGFPFVSGSILFGTGLITLGLVNKK